MKFCFDIDGVLFEQTDSGNYYEAVPIQSAIDIVKKLYMMGHTIILYTSRGFETGMDWLEITSRQLNVHGIPYYELHMGKPFADYYIDDRMLSTEDLGNMVYGANKIKPLLRNRIKTIDKV